MITLPLWLPLYYYMISHERFVTSVDEKPQINNDQSGVIKQSTRSEGNIKGLNTNHNLKVKNPLVFKFDNAANSDSTDNNLKLYEVTKNETNCYLYKFNQYAKCVEVKYNKLLVWSSNQGPTRYPREISFKPSENNVVIYFSDDFKLDYSHYDIKIGESQFVSKSSSKVESEKTSPGTVTDTLLSQTQSVQEHTLRGRESAMNVNRASKSHQEHQHDSKPVDSSPVTEAPTPEPTSEQEDSEVSEAHESKDDHMTESYQTSDDSKPVDSSVVTEAPTDEPTSEQEDSEVSEAHESKDDHMTESYQTSDDSKPVDLSPVAEAPTDEPTSEQEPTKTPEETKDVADRVSQQSESLEHDSTAVTEAPTTQPSSDEGHSEVSEAHESKDDHMTESYQTSDDSKPVDLSPVAEAPTDEPTSEQEPTETPEETRDSADFVSQQSENLELDSTAVTEPPTDEPTSEQEPTETPEETRDSANFVSRASEVKLVDLDLKKTNSTTEFDYAKNNNVVTYTPKAGYGFGTVKIKKGSCDCAGSDKVVWEAEDASKHSNKVVVESGSDKKKTLTIHLVDGTTKVFKKPKDGDFVLQNDDSSDDSKPVNSSDVTHTPTPELSSEKEPTETPEETEDSTDDHMTESYQTSDDSKPVDLSPVAEAPTDEPTSEQEDSEVSEAHESKDDHMTESYQTSDDSKPVDLSPVAEAPTDEPTSEQEPTETPEETRDSADFVSRASENLEHDSTAVTEAPTTQPSSDEGHSEVSEAHESKDDHMTESYQTSDDSKPVDLSPVAEAPTAERSSEEEFTKTPEETRDSADFVSRASENLELDGAAPTEPPTDEPTSEQEPTETPEETRDSANFVSRASEVKLVDLDLKKTNSTTEFDYAKNNNVVTYTPKAGYGFGTVKKGKSSCNCCGSDKVVWEAEDASKHSNKVVVESGSDKQKTLTIHLVDGTTKVYKKFKDGDFVLQNDDSSDDSKPVNSSDVTHTSTTEASPEQEPTETPEETKDSTDPVSKKTSEVKLIDLDITKTESTTEFDYAKNGNVVTYTPKAGYGFGTVKKGKGSCNCMGSEKIIWESKDKAQASNKVIASHVDRKIDPDLFCLEIHIVDGSTLRYFNSDSVNSPYYKKWVQRYDDVPKESHPAQIKIYTKDETESKEKENDTDKYTVDIFKEGESSKYGYRIKNGVKCTKVKYNDNEIWNDTENTNHKNIDRLIYDQGDKNIILEHNSFIFKTYKIPDEPKQK